jgi:hypothetical protein
MKPLEREETRWRAQAKLAAMRERAVHLRRRVVVGAIVGFALLWSAIFAQMTLGHDPVLGAGTRNVRAAAQESFASDPERRADRPLAPPGESDEEEAEAEPFIEERAEIERLEAAAEELAAIEAGERAAIEAEELEAATTGQS